MLRRRLRVKDPVVRCAAFAICEFDRMLCREGVLFLDD